MLVLTFIDLFGSVNSPLTLASVGWMTGWSLDLICPSVILSTGIYILAISPQNEKQGRI